MSHFRTNTARKLINTVLITIDHDWHSSEGEKVDPTHAPEDVLQCSSNVAQESAYKVRICPPNGCHAVSIAASYR